MWSSCVEPDKYAGFEEVRIFTLCLSLSSAQNRSYLKPGSDNRRADLKHIHSLRTVTGEISSGTFVGTETKSRLSDNVRVQIRLKPPEVPTDTLRMMYQSFPFAPDQPKKHMTEANVSQKLLLNPAVPAEHIS